MKCVIVRYAEIGLKGKNKSDFEKALVNNIKLYLKKNNIQYTKVQRKFSRIIIYTEDKLDLINIFGISSFSHAIETNTNIKSLKNEAEKIIKDYNIKTEFRVSTQRIDKKFELNSMEVERIIGAFVIEKKSSKVNLKNFEKEISIEILPDKAYVFKEKIAGPGGLPVGIEGKVLALIEDNNSIEAAKLAMKRGCEIILASFEKKDISCIEKYFVRKKEINLIRNIRQAEELAKNYGAKAIVLGQTLRDYKDIETDLLVLRPLVGRIK